MGGLSLMLRRGAIQAHPTISEGGYILSADKGDPEVFRILMSKGISSDGVGITKEDAEKVTSIGQWFRDNKNIIDFRELLFFTKVISIENDAFFGCSSLRMIDVSNISYIGAGAFYGCEVLTGEINVPKVTGKIGNGSFRNSKILSFIAPYATSIDATAFQYCSSMVTLDIRNVISIGIDAFFGCSTLETIDIRNASIVDNGAFYGCSALKLVDIQNPASIGDGAFYNCSALQAVVIRAITPPTLVSSNAFSGTNSCLIYVPDESIEVYKTAPNWSSIVSRIKPVSEYQG